MSKVNININQTDKEEAEDDESSGWRTSMFKGYPQLNVGENWLTEWSIEDTARRVEFQLNFWESGIKQMWYVEKCKKFGQLFQERRKKRSLERKNIAETTGIAAEVLLCLEKGLLFPQEIKLLLDVVAITICELPDVLYQSFCDQEVDDEIPISEDFQPALCVNHPFDVFDEEFESFNDSSPNYDNLFTYLQN